MTTCRHCGVYVSQTDKVGSCDRCWELEELVRQCPARVMESILQINYPRHDFQLVEDPQPSKPTVPEVMPLVRRLYERNPVGCCLHIVLDDGNVEDHSVEFCIDQAHDRGHEECLELAKILFRMSRTQRRKLAYGR